MSVFLYIPFGRGGDRDPIWWMQCIRVGLVKRFGTTGTLQTIITVPPITVPEKVLGSLGKFATRCFARCSPRVMRVVNISTFHHAAHAASPND